MSSNGQKQLVRITEGLNRGQIGMVQGAIGRSQIEVELVSSSKNILVDPGHVEPIEQAGWMNNGKH